MFSVTGGVELAAEFAALPVAAFEADVMGEMLVLIAEFLWMPARRRGLSNG
jgi:hypothetical protein